MAPTEENDPFDSLLTLEDDLYTAAYAQGTADGSRAGRIEGRLFGLEKGFEKFAALGQLHGRAAVWSARLPPSPSEPQNPAKDVAERHQSATGRGDESQDGEETKMALPLLRGNERLRKHIQMLHALTDPATFSTLNIEDAVADFDDRFKRAGAKAKIVERTIGEAETSSLPDREAPQAAARKVRLSAAGKKKKGDDSMEDFVGSKFLS